VYFHPRPHFPFAHEHTPRTHARTHTRTHTQNRFSAEEDLVFEAMMSYPEGETPEQVFLRFIFCARISSFILMTHLLICFFFS
jgi:hypothetical protein